MVTIRVENALALGVGYYPKENLLLTAGTTVSGDLMTNVGVSYKFGENKTLAKISPASYNALETTGRYISKHKIKNYRKQ